MGMLMEQVLKQAGDTLTRENVMKQATALELTLPMLSAGMRVKTSPTDYAPLEQLQMLRVKGEAYEPFGPCGLERRQRLELLQRLPPAAGPIEEID